MTANNVALLPFRSNSKRLKNKNFLPVCGIPLYLHVLRNIIDSGIFDSVIIATDEPRQVESDIFEHRISGPVTVHSRSPDTSSDFAPTELVMLEIIKEFDLKPRDWLLLFQVTNPFLNERYFTEISQIIKNDCHDSIVSGVKQKRFLIDDICTPGFSRPRTQELGESCLETGLFWGIKVEAFKETGQRIGLNPNIVFIDEADDFDIDERWQFDVAKARLQKEFFKRNENFTRRIIEENRNDYYHKSTDPDGVQRNMLEDVDGRLAFAKDEIEFIRAQYCSEDKHLNILDIGCGIGVISREAFGKNAFIHGVEPSLLAAEKAKERLDVVDIGTFESFLPLMKDESFDFIVAFHVVEHVSDPNQLFDEIERILRPGGSALISTPDFEGPCAKKYGEKFRLLHDGEHQSLFGSVGLINSLISRGLTLKKLLYPYVDTVFMTEANLLKILDENIQQSPPFVGNVVSIFVEK